MEFEKTIDNQIEILKFMSSVQSPINDKITEDFILANLDDTDKKAVTDLVTNAYFTISLIDQIIRNTKEYEFDANRQTWIKKNIGDKKKLYLENIRNNIFNKTLIKIYMTCILNRNDKNNHLMNLLARYNVNEENEEQKEDRNIQEKLKRLIKPNNITTQE